MIPFMGKMGGGQDMVGFPYGTGTQMMADPTWFGPLGSWHGVDNIVPVNPFTSNVILAEEKEAYTLKCPLPGMKKADVSVELSDLGTGRGQSLILTARKSQTDTSESSTGTRMESMQQRFSREFKLPHKVDTSKIVVKFKEGILDIAVPKSHDEEVHGVKKIAVN